MHGAEYEARRWWLAVDLAAGHSPGWRRLAELGGGELPGWWCVVVTIGGEEMVGETDFRDAVSGSSLRQAAVIAGIGYLLNPVTFAEVYAMPRLVVSDPARTVANLAAHPQMFAAALLAYFFSVVGDVVIAWALYVLLAPVNRALSLLAAWLQLVYAAATVAAVGNLGLLYRLVAIPDYAEKVSAAALPLQGVLLVGAYRSGWGLGLIVFGLHLVVLGWLMTRATYLPRWLGWLLMLDGCAWVVDSLGIYLYPKVPLDFLKILFLPELMLMMWLLGWGWRIKAVGEGASE